MIIGVIAELKQNHEHGRIRVYFYRSKFGLFDCIHQSGEHLLMKMLLVFWISVAALLASCNQKPEQPAQSQNTAQPTANINDVIAAHTEEWMQLPGVVGASEGQQNGRQVIKIQVQDNTQELQQKLPKVQDGYPVVVEVVGQLNPPGDSPEGLDATSKGEKPESGAQSTAEPSTRRDTHKETKKK